MLQSPVGRLRFVGILEGISFLVLLGIAMPLKYLKDIPEAVAVTGWVHGVLFVAYCITLSIAHITRDWPVTKTLLCFIAALVPFGPFVLDYRLRGET